MMVRKRKSVGLPRFNQQCVCGVRALCVCARVGGFEKPRVVPANVQVKKQYEGRVCMRRKCRNTRPGQPSEAEGVCAWRQRESGGGANGKRSFHHHPSGLASVRSSWQRRPAVLISTMLYTQGTWTCSTP